MSRHGCRVLLYCCSYIGCCTVAPCSRHAGLAGGRAGRQVWASRVCGATCMPTLYTCILRTDRGHGRQPPAGHTVHALPSIHTQRRAASQAARPTAQHGAACHASRQPALRVCGVVFYFYRGGRHSTHRACARQPGRPAVSSVYTLETTLLLHYQLEAQTQAQRPRGRTSPHCKGAGAADRERERERGRGRGAGRRAAVGGSKAPEDCGECNSNGPSSHHLHTRARALAHTRTHDSQRRSDLVAIRP